MHAATESLTAVIAWLALFPVSLVIPRDPRRLIVIGRGAGNFSDNAKYFFEYAHRQAQPAGIRVEFLTEDRELRDTLRQHGTNSVLYPSLAGLWGLLRAGVIIADSAEWIRKGRFQATRGALHVQLWHGVPLKQIELPLYRERLARLGVIARFLLGVQKKLTGRYTTTDLLVSTSAFVTERAFRSAFSARDITESGYPRNDILFRDIGEHAEDSLLWINTDQAAITKIRAARARGCRVGLYAPTFRKDLLNPFEQRSVDLYSLSRCAEKNNLLLVFKLHPAMKGLQGATDLDYLIEYDSRADVYPALALTDFLVTDYSSIYFDYLLLDRPVLFFPFDYDSYISQDRHLLFDYEEMTPGIKCHTQTELEEAIGLLCQEGDDGRAASRRQVREKIYSWRDANAAQRILSYLIKHGIDHISYTS